MSEKNIYFFGASGTDGNSTMAEVLGNKGAGLAELSSLQINIPEGFTIISNVCSQVNKLGDLPDCLKEEVKLAIKELEKRTQKKLGDTYNPLILSVRSGSKASMPGMMDTILNLGLNDKTVKALANLTNDADFANNCYQRFLHMFGTIVFDIDEEKFTNINKNEIQAYLNIYKENGLTFPQDPYEQLFLAIKAVFRSWNSERANKFREIYNISENLGTAVNIQQMVFGNFKHNSGTGVCFSRDPSTGENKIYGEFLLNAQGEDVVSGTKTPWPIDDSSVQNTMKNIMPESYMELTKVAKKLEKHFADMQDIEFTVENGKLWILQSRSAKRTKQAALKIALEMYDAGLITKEKLIADINIKQLEQLLHPTLELGQNDTAIVSGLPASPGAASGKVVFNSIDAAASTDAVIMLRPETSPEDIVGMNTARGIVTSSGGMTSHAAVVTRGMGKACITGAEQLVIDEKNKVATVGKIKIREGDFITIDGASGNVYLGVLKTVSPEISQDFLRIIEIAKSIKNLKIRANVDNGQDAQTAVSLGAEGIGLCRTEHMFFDSKRILEIRKMIFAVSSEQRQRSLDNLLPYQQSDFAAIFNAMRGKPVTIRLLDPPLHEFLPNNEDDLKILAVELKMDIEWIKARKCELHESNPMLGHRGCRLGITNPEIYEMQIKAILAAAKEMKYTEGLEVMIPLVQDTTEFAMLKELVLRVANKIEECPSFQVGTMIELPRAALLADEIAEHAEFFSFGTNDLTQTCLGISRDDSSKFMNQYLDSKIFKNDPFASLDKHGVGKLIKMGCELGRSAKPDLKIGICGEHGGDAESIKFCEQIGMNYVSCSTYRVPIAIVAAAQAAINQGGGF